MINESILQLLIQDLSVVPFHNDIHDITRYTALNAPCHIAIHQIDISDQPEAYVKLHRHHADELNIILSHDEDFQYKITVGDEEKIVTAPSVIWIPKGMAHSANVIHGKGFYICIIFEQGYQATC